MCLAADVISSLCVHICPDASASVHQKVITQGPECQQANGLLLTADFITGDKSEEAD